MKGFLLIFVSVLAVLFAAGCELQLPGSVAGPPNDARAVTTITWNDGNVQRSLSDRTGTDKILNKTDEAVLKRSQFRVSYSFDPARPLSARSMAVLYQGGTLIARAWTTEPAWAEFDPLGRRSLVSGKELTLRFKDSAGKTSAGIQAAMVRTAAVANDPNSITTITWSDGSVRMTLSDQGSADKALTQSDHSIIKTKPFRVSYAFGTEKSFTVGSIALLYQGDKLVVQAKTTGPTSAEFDPLGPRSLDNGTALTLRFKDSAGNISSGIRTAAARTSASANDPSSVTSITWSDRGSRRTLSDRSGGDFILNKADEAVLRRRPFQVSYVFSTAKPFTADSTALIYQADVLVAQAAVTGPDSADFNPLGTYSLTDGTALTLRFRDTDGNITSGTPAAAVHKSAAVNDPSSVTTLTWINRGTLRTLSDRSSTDKVLNKADAAVLKHSQFRISYLFDAAKPFKTGSRALLFQDDVLVAQAWTTGPTSAEFDPLGSRTLTDGTALTLRFKDSAGNISTGKRVASVHTVASANDPSSVTTITWNDGGTQAVLSDRGGADAVINKADHEILKVKSFHLRYVFDTAKPLTVGSRAALYQGDALVARARRTGPTSADFEALGNKSLNNGVALMLRFQSSAGNISAGTQAAAVQTVAAATDPNSVTTITWNGNGNQRTLSNQSGFDMILNKSDEIILRRNPFRVNYVFSTANPFTAESKALLYQGDALVARATKTGPTSAEFGPLGSRSLTDGTPLTLRFKDSAGNISSGVRTAAVHTGAVVNAPGSVTTISWSERGVQRTLSNQGGTDKVLNKADEAVLRRSPFRVSYAFGSGKPFTAGSTALLYQDDSLVAQAWTTGPMSADFDPMGSRSLAHGVVLELRFKDPAENESSGIRAAEVRTLAAANDPKSLTTIISWLDGGTRRKLSDQSGTDSILNRADEAVMKRSGFRVGYVFESAKPFTAGSTALLYQGDNLVAQAKTTGPTSADFAPLGSRFLTDGTVLSLRFRDSAGNTSPGIRTATVRTSAAANDPRSVTAITWNDGGTRRTLSDQSGADEILNKADEAILKRSAFTVNYVFSSAKPFTSGGTALLYQDDRLIARASATGPISADFDPLGNRSLINGTALTLKFADSAGNTTPGITAATVRTIAAVNDPSLVSTITWRDGVFRRTLSSRNGADSVLNRADEAILKRRPFRVSYVFNSGKSFGNGSKAMLYQGESLIAQAWTTGPTSADFDPLGSRSLAHGVALVLRFKDPAGNFSSGLQVADVRTIPTSNDPRSTTTITYNDSGTLKVLSNQNGTDKILNKADEAILKRNPFRLRYAFDAVKPFISGSTALLHQGETLVAQAKTTGPTFADFNALGSRSLADSAALVLKFKDPVGNTTPGIRTAEVRTTSVNAFAVRIEDTGSSDRYISLPDIGGDTPGIDVIFSTSAALTSPYKVTVSGFSDSLKTFTRAARVSGRLANTYKVTVARSDITDGRKSISVGIDAAGNPGETAGEVLVEVDTSPPTIASAVSNAWRDKIIVTLNEEPKDLSATGPSGFNVFRSGGRSAKITAVAAAAKSVTLSLSSVLYSAETGVTVSYRKPHGTVAKRVEDLAGNPLESVRQTVEVQHDISLLSLSYETVRIAETKDYTAVPKWSSGSPTARYSIRAVSGKRPPGILVDPDSGELTIDSTAVKNGTYSVTAVGQVGSAVHVKTATVAIIRPTPANRSALRQLVNAAITAAVPSPNLNYIDTSGVTNMSSLFQSKGTFNGDISEWDVSNVTNMSYMFYGADAFTGDISKWDVSNVTNMSYMFYGADAFTGDISGWDVSNVTNMSYMFYGADAFTGDISGWDVSNVTNMSAMFLNTSAFSGDISEWDVSNVTNMSFMFYGADAFTGDISGWDVSNVTNMSAMFLNTSAFSGDISEWDVSNVTNMSYMFYGADAFTGDISGWDVSNVTNMHYMFSGADAFTGDISKWDVSNVTNMSRMFYNSKAFNQDLTAWKDHLKSSTNVTDMFDNSGLSNPPCWYRNDRVDTTRCP